MVWVEAGASWGMLELAVASHQWHRSQTLSTHVPKPSCLPYVHPFPLTAPAVCSLLVQDASTALRHSESGMIDSVLVTTGADGQRFVKMRVGALPAHPPARLPACSPGVAPQPVCRDTGLLRPPQAQLATAYLACKRGLSCAPLSGASSARACPIAGEDPS